MTEEADQPEECDCPECRAAEPDLGGRPPHVPTEANRAKVEALSGYGAQQWYIAAEIGVCRTTLMKYYRAELNRGLEKANVAVTQSLHKRALGYQVKTQKVIKNADGSEKVADLTVHVPADTASAIWWDKTRNKQAETVNHRHAGPDGGPVVTITATMTPKEAQDAYARSLAADDSEG